MPEPNQANAPPAQKPPGGEWPPTLGDFELVDRIGQGAVGTVFKARQRSMDRLVALKVLRPSLAGDAAYVERFWHEARAAARLHHPNIVLAINAGEDQGFYYFAMEYVEGHSVGLLLKAGPLEERHALEIALQVARALDYAWSKERIVHRDIKPGNIIITPDGTAKLADLGLAHEASLDEEDELTAEGKIVGTPFYIAPEQILRRTDLDVRCDLYALGASLFHMLTGRPPFEGPDAKAVLPRHLHEPVPDPRQLRPELEEGTARVVCRLLAKAREDRYPDAKALVADLEALLKAGAAPSPRPATPVARLRRVPSRRRREPLAPYVAMLLIVLALGFVAFILWRMGLRQPSGTREAIVERVGTATPAAAAPAAEQAWRDAEAFAAAHPADYAAAIGRLRAVETSHRDTRFAQSAAELRGRLEADLQKKAAEALAALTRRAEALIEQGKYAEAPDAFQQFPQGMLTDAWRDRVAAARAAVERKGREAFDAALAKGDKAADEGRLDEALRAFEALGASLPAPWREEVASRVAAVRTRQEEAAARARAEQEAAHLRLLADIVALQRERRYADAAQLVRGRLDAASPQQREELTRELNESVFLQELWSRIETGAARFLGKPFTVRGISGTLVSVKDGRLTIDSRGGSFGEEARSLSADDVLRFVLPELPPAAAPLAAARFLIAEGDTAAAEARLKALEDAGTDVAALRARFRRVTSIGFVITAGKELEKARRLLADGDLEGAAAALRAFLDRYGTEPPAASLCTEAQRLLKEATAPRPAVTAPARLRIACDGPCRVFLNGEPVASGTAADGQFAEADLKVKEGDTLAVDATSQSDHRGLYALLDVQDGRFVLPTDATWRWQADPPAGWQTAPDEAAKWRPALLAYSPHVKPGYAKAGLGLPGWWIWGNGARCVFRKIIHLQKTAAARQAEETALQRALTARHGAPVKATLWLACRDSCQLLLNGRVVGCAAAFLPEGASYSLLVRQGDALGVQATSFTREGWLDARLDVDGLPAPVCTDRTWVYAVAPPPDDWADRGSPSGAWRPPEFHDRRSQRIWGDESTLFFRKAVNLKERRDDVPSFHGRARMLARRKVELTYDFRTPEQLADWHTEGTWAWTRGKVGGASGGFYAQPFAAREIQLEATTEPDLPLILGIWGEDPSRRTGISVSLNFPRRGSVSLRSGTRTLATGRLPGSASQAHRVLLRKDADQLAVLVDGREVLSALDTEVREPGELWRVGFQAGGGGKAVIAGARIIGEPDWDQLQRGERRRGANDPAPEPPAKGPEPPNP